MKVSVSASIGIGVKASIGIGLIYGIGTSLYLIHEETLIAGRVLQLDIAQVYLVDPKFI